VVAITNETDSPLARRADAVIELHSGTEATVSTKSYLNTLAAHQQLAAAFTGVPADDIYDTAKMIENLDPGGVLAEVAHRHEATAGARLAFIGNRDHASTALYAGLITKEAAKVAAEGYIGGQFRHGPLELAGPGLTAVLFGCYNSDDNRSLHQLAAELVQTGSVVLLVGDLEVDGGQTVYLEPASDLAGLAGGSLVAEHLAVGLAKARGIEPGAFSFGRKVTTAL
jgi:glucosamine--fructose-6-phosphate aminotransferase (isomerizing)